MDFDVGITSEAKTNHTNDYQAHVDAYIARDDLKDLLVGEEAISISGEGSIHLHPPVSKSENNDTVGHYDDVLRALGEAYTLIQHLEIMDSAALESVEKQKIKNTYEFYHEQQKQYR